MTAPMLNSISREAAMRELEELKSSVEGGFKEFEDRVYSYNLTPREFAIWERISELQWLLGER